MSKFDPNYTGPVNSDEFMEVDPKEAQEVYEELYQMLEQQEMERRVEEEVESIVRTAFWVRSPRLAI